MGRRRGALLALLLSCAVAGVLVVRALGSGREALGRGDAAQAAGDADTAIWWWQRAARWYLPGADHVEAAYQRLTDAARAAESAGKDALALRAYRGIRSSIHATRGLLSPFADRLPETNRHIAELMAGTDPDPDADPAARRAWHQRALDGANHPNAFFALLALAGLALWVGSAVGFAWKAVDREGHLVRRTALRCGAGVVLGLLVWVLALFLA